MRKTGYAHSAVLFLLIICGGSADAGTLTSYLAACIAIIYTLMASRKEGAQGKSLTLSNYKFLPIASTIVVYNYLRVGTIPLAMILLLIAFAGLNLLKTEQEKTRRSMELICYIVITLGLLQYITHYATGQNICFFDYQCELATRLNFFNNNYRANSLFFEPGDFATFIILSTSTIKSKTRELIMDITTCLITLSASGVSLVILKAIILYGRSNTRYIQRAAAKLIRHNKTSIGKIFLLGIALASSQRFFRYLANKGFGTKMDSAFSARSELITYFIDNLNLTTLIKGNGFAAYDTLRLVDSIAPIASLLTVSGIAGTLFYFSALSYATGIQMAIILSMARWSPGSSVLMATIIILSNLSIQKIIRTKNDLQAQFRIESKWGDLDAHEKRGQ